MAPAEEAVPASPRRILVTGSAGFIGRRVVELLRADGGDVVELRGRWSDTEELAAYTVGVTEFIHLGWYAEPRNYLTSVEGNLSSLQSSIELPQALAAGA